MKTAFNGYVSVGYGGRRYYLSSSGFNCTTLWLFSDSHETAVSHKQILRESVSLNFTLFCRVLGFFYSISCLQKHKSDTFIARASFLLIGFLRSFGSKNSNAVKTANQFRLKPIDDTIKNVIKLELSPYHEVKLVLETKN